MAEAARSDYEEGHLLVAAIRVLSHREGRPPSVEEVAASIGRSDELAYHLARRLEAAGIIRAVKTPFETRLVVEDHTLLEDLPRDAAGPSVATEFEMFRQKQDDKSKELDKLFAEGALEKKRQERSGALEEQFKKFRESRRYRPPSGTPPEPSGRSSPDDDG